MKRVAIYDVDSKIPNLALMRISQYHRKAGDNIEMYSPLFKAKYDRIYASKIFDFSDGSLLDPDCMVIGGTGWSKTSELPPEVAECKPDYSLYKYPHNIGFAMRGCRLRCSFCVVPEKEGKPRSEHTIYDIWDQRNSKFLVLLDNDFFGNPEWKERIEEINEIGLRVNFSQGINIRNLRPDQAAALASVKFRNINDTMKQVHFAWDDPRHEKLIHKGIKTAIDAGIKPRQMAFYVLIGYHSTEEEDLHRVEVLRSYGCDPYAMPFNKDDPYQRSFTRWVNHKAIFKTVPWGEYKGGIKKTPVNDRQIDLVLST